jgi:hypothetical protein
MTAAPVQQQFLSGCGLRLTFTGFITHSHPPCRACRAAVCDVVVLYSLQAQAVQVATRSQPWDQDDQQPEQHVAGSCAWCHHNIVSSTAPVVPMSQHALRCAVPLAVAFRKVVPNSSGLQAAFAEGQMNAAPGAAAAIEQHQGAQERTLRVCRRCVANATIWGQLLV